MQLDQIWRYPVKSMAGERLTTVELTEEGVLGDRLLQVHDRFGQVLTARSHPGLLAFHAVLGPDGEPRIDGEPWTSAKIVAAVERVGGAGARLVRDASPERFDILPLLVATDGALQAFGRDPRRLRPNLVLGGVPGLAERGWEGEGLAIGDALIGLADLRMRCVMTTYDPDTQRQDPTVLREIVQKFGGKLALNAEVLVGGRVSEGMEARLVETEQPVHA